MRQIAAAMFFAYIAFSQGLSLASAQGSTGTDFQIVYSFDEVNSAVIGADVSYFTNSTFITTMGPGESSYHSSIGSFQVLTSQPFLSDKNGFLIDAVQAARDAVLMGDKWINSTNVSTYIQWKKYYYSMDVLVYSDLLLPSDFTTDTLQAAGWTDADNPRSSLGYKMQHEHDCLVLQQDAPNGQIDSLASQTGVNVPWGTIGAYTFVANSKSYTYVQPDWTYPSSIAYTRLALDDAFAYSAKSINMGSIFGKVGGKYPLKVQPSINVTIQPSVIRTENIAGNQTEIYAAIVATTCTKLKFGKVETDYGMAASEFSETVQSQDLTSIAKDEKTSGDPVQKPAETKSSPGSNGQSYTIETTIDADYTKSSSTPTSRQDGVQKGTSVPMYVVLSNGSSSWRGVSTDLRLFKNAPKSVQLRPTFTIQPDWYVWEKGVSINGNWIRYYNPWKSWNGNLVYEDLPDIPNPKTFSVRPIVKVEVVNKFLINRFTMAVVVGTVATKPIILGSGGSEIADPKIGGNNGLQIEDPLNQSATYRTPSPKRSIWEDIAAGWNDFWDSLKIDPVTGLLFTIIIVVIAIVVIYVVIRVVTGRGGGRANIMLGQPSAPAPASAPTPASEPSSSPKKRKSFGSSK
jgi:hypothetical protein